MPKKVHRLATKLQKQGYSESSAWAIAHSAMKKKGSKSGGKGKSKGKY